MTTMIVWDVFAFCYTVAGWVVFFLLSPTAIRNNAQKEDGSRLFVFFIIVVASFASMFTVLLLMLTKASFSGQGNGFGLFLLVAISGMLLSWLMVHTTFSFHYAHMYYSDDDTDKKQHAGGLEFPKEKQPDYLDFAYFSFVIGMTFQVSDVEISSRSIRRLALLQGLLSFGLNTFVVALTINLVAGLMK